MLLVEFHFAHQLQALDLNVVFKGLGDGGEKVLVVWVEGVDQGQVVKTILKQKVFYSWFSV